MKEAPDRGFKGCIGCQQRDGEEGFEEALRRNHGSRSRKQQGFTGRSGFKAKWRPHYERL